MYRKIIHLIMTENGNYLIESISSFEKLKIAVELFSAMVAEKKIKANSICFVTGKPSRVNYIKNSLLDNEIFNVFRPRVLSIQDIALELIKKNILNQEMNKTEIDVYRYHNSKKLIISKVMEKMKESCAIARSKSFIENIFTSISFIKNNRINVSAIDRIEGFEWFGTMIKNYENMLAANNLLYTEEIIERAIYILSEENISVPSYNCIFLDDFQNVNRLEYNFLLKYIEIVKSRNMSCKIIVSANPHYTLTQYRGSSVNFIKNVVTDLNIADKNRIRLSLNPNVPSHIQNVLKYISDNQSDKSPDCVESDLFRDNLGDIVCIQVNRETDEPFFIASEIKKLIAKGNKPGEIGICYYRIKEEARFCANTLQYNKIPFRIESGLETGRSVSFKFMENCVLAVKNINDEGILRKIINSHLFGLNPVEVSRILIESKKQSIPLLFGILRFADRIILSDQRKRLQEIIIYLKNCSAETKMDKFFKDIARISGLFDYAKDKTSEVAVLKKIFQSLDFFKDFFIAINGESPSINDYSIYADYILPDYIRDDTHRSDDCVRIVSIFDCDSYNFKTIFVPCMTAKFFPDQFIDFTPPLLKGFLKNNNYKRHDRHILMEALSNVRERCYLIHNRESGEPSPLFDQLKNIESVKLIDTGAGFANYNSVDSINSISGLKIWIQNNIYNLKDELKKDLESKFCSKYPDMGRDENNILPRNKELVKLPGDFVFSSTDIDSYLNCPRKFFFERLMSIDIADQKNNDNKFFGQLIHSVLELFHFIYRDIRSSSDISSLHEAILKILRKKNDDFVQFPKLQRELNFLNAAECINNYISTLSDEKPLKVIAIEKKIHFYIDDIPFSIKIDRIDNGAQGGIRIIDYKTTKDKKGEKALKNMFYSDKPKSFQLPIYYFASKYVLGLEPKAMGIFYLQAESKEGDLYCHKSVIPIGYDSDSKSVSYDELEEVKENIKILLRTIQSGFYPVKGKSANCHECGYKLVCG